MHCCKFMIVIVTDVFVLHMCHMVVQYVQNLNLQFDLMREYNTVMAIRLSHTVTIIHNSMLFTLRCKIFTTTVQYVLQTISSIQQEIDFTALFEQTQPIISEYIHKVYAYLIPYIVLQMYGEMVKNIPGGINELIRACIVLAENARRESGMDRFPGIFDSAIRELNNML